MYPKFCPYCKSKKIKWDERVKLYYCPDCKIEWDITDTPPKINVFGTIPEEWKHEFVLYLPCCARKIEHSAVTKEILSLVQRNFGLEMTVCEKCNVAWLIAPFSLPFPRETKKRNKQ